MRVEFLLSFFISVSKGNTVGLLPRKRIEMVPAVAFHNHMAVSRKQEGWRDRTDEYFTDRGQ